MRIYNKRTLKRTPTARKTTKQLIQQQSASKGMVNAQLKKIHERLDEQDEKIDKILRQLTEEKK